MPDLWNSMPSNGLRPPHHARSRYNLGPQTVLHVAVLNNISMLFWTIVVKRLEDMLLSLIYSDQVGLIKNRQGSYNIRRLAHLVKKGQRRLEPPDDPGFARCKERHQSGDLGFPRGGPISSWAKRKLRAGSWPARKRQRQPSRLTKEILGYLHPHE